MNKRKKSKDLFEEFFGKSIFEELFEKNELGLDEYGTNYSITVVQEGNNTIVHAKASKGTDVEKLRKELERQYPKAKIIIEGGRPLIEEVKSNEKLEGFKIASEKDKKHLIEEIK
ncbi:MAG: hypothetical protein QW589_03615 [Candidatus Bathyarchaeia archaeon]